MSSLDCVSVEPNRSWKTLSLAVGLPICAAAGVYYFMKRINAGGVCNASARHSVVRIQVPKDKIGAIIGHLGGVIKQLETKHGCCVKFQKINLDQYVEDVMGGRVLIIRGKTQNVNAAELEVRTILANAPPLVVEDIEVPRLAISFIIGRRGETIKEIRRISGARVDVGQNDSSCDFGTVTLRGRRNQVNYAKLMIEEIVNDNQQLAEQIARSAEAKRQRAEQRMSVRYASLPVRAGGVCKVYVTAVCDPGRFFVQIVNQQQLMLDRLTTHMTTYYNDSYLCSSSLPSASFKVGDFVAVPQNDERFYRAKIIALTNDDQADIDFLDTGESDCLPLTLLQPLKEDFLLRLPLQAIECRLALNPVDGAAWTEEAIVAFENLTHSTKYWPLQAVVVEEYSLRVYTVKLSDASCSPVVNVGDALIKLGHAQKVGEFAPPQRAARCSETEDNSGYNPSVEENESANVEIGPDCESSDDELMGGIADVALDNTSDAVPAIARLV